MERQERSDNYARETGLPRAMFISGERGPLLDRVAGEEPIEQDAQCGQVQLEPPVGPAGDMRRPGGSFGKVGGLVMRGPARRQDVRS
jgi:hypothetical protein